MATKWMRDAVKRPGALTRRARAAGLTPLEFARNHARDRGLRGEESRFALVAQGEKIPATKPRRHARLPRAAAG